MSTLTLIDIDIKNYAKGIRMCIGENPLNHDIWLTHDEAVDLHAQLEHKLYGQHL